MIKFLDLTKQYQSIKPEIDRAISAVLDSSAFIGGSFVRDFEDAFAEYCGAHHCIGVGNGTDALEIAIEALDLPRGSEVIVPANSFIASAEAVTRQGLKVVFADCEPSSYTLSIPDLEAKITDNTSAIIAVHLYGHPCDMGEVARVAKEHNLKIIEDCAQAHGAEYKGRRVGALGDIAAFSFYPGKNLGAYGDAGAIVTNSSDLALKSRMIANHGRIAKYDHEFEGRNSRLDAMQASILSVKLRYLDEWTASRIAVADYYLENLKGLGDIVLPVRQPWAKQVYHLFVVRTHFRDELKAHLDKYGVETGIHYPIALPGLKAYKHLSQDQGAPFSTDASQTLLSLPIGEHLALAQINGVCASIEKFYAPNVAGN